MRNTSDKLRRILGPIANVGFFLAYLMLVKMLFDYKSSSKYAYDLWLGVVFMAWFIFGIAIFILIKGIATIKKENIKLSWSYLALSALCILPFTAVLPFEFPLKGTGLSFLGRRIRDPALMPPMFGGIFLMQGLFSGHAKSK